MRVTYDVVVLLDFGGLRSRHPKLICLVLRVIALRLQVLAGEIDRGQDGTREYHHRGQKDRGFGHRGERQHIFSVVRLKPQSSFAAGGGRSDEGRALSSHLSQPSTFLTASMTVVSR